MQERDHDLNLEWTKKKKSIKKKPQTNIYLILQIYYILQKQIQCNNEHGTSRKHALPKPTIKNTTIKKNCKHKMIPRQLDKHNEDTFVYHQISNISYQVIIHSHIIKKKKKILWANMYFWGDGA